MQNITGIFWGGWVFHSIFTQRLHAILKLLFLSKILKLIFLVPKPWERLRSPGLIPRKVLIPLDTNLYKVLWIPFPDHASYQSPTPKILQLCSLEYVTSHQQTPLHLQPFSKGFLFISCTSWTWYPFENSDPLKSSALVLLSLYHWTGLWCGEVSFLLLVATSRSFSFLIPWKAPSLVLKSADNLLSSPPSYSYYLPQVTTPHSLKILIPVCHWLQNYFCHNYWLCQYVRRWFFHSLAPSSTLI